MLRETPIAQHIIYNKMGLFKSSCRPVTDPADRALAISLAPPPPQEKTSTSYPKNVSPSDFPSPVCRPKDRFPGQTPSGSGPLHKDLPPNFEQMSITAAVRTSILQTMKREMDSLRCLDNSAMVINTDALMQGVGISWRERRCQALHTPIRETRQISRETVDDFMAQGRHHGWAQSTEVIQRSTMTKRRARRLNRCRPSISLDEHRHDHGDNNDGAQAMVVQNNNQHHQYVSFSRKIGRFTESQSINFTQMRINADSKQTTNNDRQGSTDARKLKVIWKSRVTGVHPLSAFMRIEAYRMFEYDAEQSMYRCLYEHDRGVDLMTL
jgi:hypothetical protein